MRNHQYCPSKADQIFLQPLRHRIIQVVGRFIQYQDICRCKQCIDQCNSLLLTAGHMLYFLVIVIEAKLVQHGSGICFNCPLIQLIHIVCDCRTQHRCSLFKFRCLRQITDLDLISYTDLTFIVWFYPGCHF